MAKPNKYLWLGVVVGSLLCCTCEAPRKNPLDPLNPNAVWASLNGAVQTLAAPIQKLADVTVVWNQTEITTTDSNGNFSFPKIRPQNGWLKTSKTGFLADSVYVTWNSRTAITQNFSLRALPRIFGRVRSQAAPNSPIQGVTVFCTINNSFTTTDANGNYAFSNMLKQSGLLYFRKDGFLPDSVLLEWQNSEAIEQNINLRRQPTLGGRVQTLRVPPMPIAGVKVTWEPGRQFTYTDASGMYLFDQPLVANGLLTFEKDGYHTIAENIEWQGTEGITKNAFLNANPRLTNFQLYTVTLNYYEPRPPTYEMDVRATIVDTEGDIDSVYIISEPMGIRAYLEYDVLDRAFERVFSAADLGLASMREVVRYEFYLRVVDRYGVTFELAEERVTQVISDEIQIEAPIGGAEVQNYVTLKWFFFNPGFDFTYHVKIFSDNDITPELMWEQSGIPSDSLSVFVGNKRLPPSDYLWEIWCVDEFNNQSRSKPASFKVTN